MKVISPISNSLVAVGDRLIPRYIIPPEPSDPTAYKSYLGTPVYSPLELLDDKPTTGIVAGQITQGVAPILLRCDNAVLTVEIETNIVKTNIQGRDGTIKEYIGLGDFSVQCEGTIVSPYPSFFPEDDFRKLVDWLTRPRQLNIASDFLLLFGITTLVIERRKWEQIRGSRNEVSFSFTASSDRSEEIILTTNDIL